MANPKVRAMLEEAKRKALAKKEAEAAAAAHASGLLPVNAPVLQQTGQAKTSSEVVTTDKGLLAVIAETPAQAVVPATPIGTALQEVFEAAAVTPAATREPINEQHRQIMESLENLKALLIASDPLFVELLDQIHKQLLQYPELTHILDDDQIAAVYQGLLKKNQVHIAVKESKKKAPAGGKKADKGLLTDGTKPGDWL